MSKNKRYFALTQEDEGGSAELYIFGDITSWPWSDSDVSAKNLSDQLKDVVADHIDVYINSYGGEVAEGLAIYNALRNHSASVTTHCEGFACSIASVIFMAGDERVMEPASLLMVHNPWSAVEGNADDMRKAADDLETIGGAIKEAYKKSVMLNDEGLKNLMDAETWIKPEDAVTWGFATSVNEDEAEDVEKVAASVAGRVYALVQKGLKPEKPMTFVSLQDAIDAMRDVLIERDVKHKMRDAFKKVADEQQMKREEILAKKNNLFSNFK